ncbi:MAG: helix-turn-helix domain-containing protein [Dermatophilaceae bacterium]
MLAVTDNDVDASSRSSSPARATGRCTSSLEELLATSDTHESELRSWVGDVPRMERPHRHDHLELNLVTRGSVRYHLGDHTFDLSAGTLALFWASIPHRIASAAHGSRMGWVHLPLDQVLSWDLSAGMLTHLLAGRPVLAASMQAPHDDRTMRLAERRFERWSADLEDDELRRAAVLEMEAMVRRLGRSAMDRTPGECPDPAVDRTAAARAFAMARFIATRCCDPISVDDVAEHVHLSPHYAMEVFRRVLGQTIGGYLTGCRVAEARRLLASTELPARDVARRAGFGSTSRFYASFAAAGLESPAMYRRHGHVLPRTPVVPGR